MIACDIADSSFNADRKHCCAGGSAAMERINVSTTRQEEVFRLPSRHNETSFQGVGGDQSIDGGNSSPTFKARTRPFAFEVGVIADVGDGEQVLDERMRRYRTATCNRFGVCCRQFQGDARRVTARIAFLHQIAPAHPAATACSCRSAGSTSRAKSRRLRSASS